MQSRHLLRSHGSNNTKTNTNIMDYANGIQRINILFAIENNYYQNRKINAIHFQSIFIHTMKRIMNEWGQIHGAPFTKFHVENSLLSAKRNDEKNFLKKREKK